MLGERTDTPWRSMGTEPRDGTEFLAYREDAGVFVATWRACEASGEDTLFAVCGEDITSIPPTHWMPLPAAPGTPPVGVSSQPDAAVMCSNGCGVPATCIGDDEIGPQRPACDICCGHDGCKPLAGFFPPLETGLDDEPEMSQATQDYVAACSKAFVAAARQPDAWAVLLSDGSPLDGLCQARPNADYRAEKWRGEATVVAVFYGTPRKGGSYRDDGTIEVCEACRTQVVEVRICRDCAEAAVTGQAEAPNATLDTLDNLLQELIRSQIAYCLADDDDEESLADADRNEAVRAIRELFRSGVGVSSETTAGTTTAMRG